MDKNVLLLKENKAKQLLVITQYLSLTLYGIVVKISKSLAKISTLPCYLVRRFANIQTLKAEVDLS